MATETHSISASLIEAFSRMDKVHQNGIAVNQLESLAPRGQVKDVFEEGTLFSGVETIRNAECSIAPVPAPHILASVTTDKYLEVATNIFAVKPKLLLKYDGVKLFSPQVVVWWKEKDSQKPRDFINLYNLSLNERIDFCDAISNKTAEAIEFITKLKGKPTIWGTWGYGSQEERVISGLIRGGPTVNEGHLHVTYYDYDEQSVSIQQLSKKEKLIHYAPWNEIVLEKFGTDMAGIIKSTLNTHLRSKTEAHVQRENKLEKHTNGSISIKNGFEINFDSEISLKDVLDTLVEMTGKAEAIYENIYDLFSNFHMHANTENRADTIIEMSNLLQRIGFESKNANEFSKFIFSINPTYGQLENWKFELTADKDNASDLIRVSNLLDKYKRIREKIKNRENKQNLSTAIVEDSLKMPNDSDIMLTWPVHFSMCYIINNYVTKKDGIYVKSISLYPEFVTTESAPERELGVVLKRPTTAN